MKRYWHLQLRAARERRPMGATAFTLTELIVVIALLALLATTQLPALNRAKTPVKFTQCQNNCRQIGQAAMLYKADNRDCYPFGGRISYPSGITNLNSWPMQLLRYLGGYQNVQPPVYLCPNEAGTAIGWPFQVHYQANRQLLSDTGDRDIAISGAMVRKPSIYWMFIEKDPQSFCSTRPGGLANPVLAAWNYPPGSPGYRRHDGGINSAAADGHAEWLRTPPYQPGRPPPANFLELGDCANGPNPASTWANNGNRVKLFSRETTSGFGGGIVDF